MANAVEGYMGEAGFKPAGFEIPDSGNRAISHQSRRHRLNVTLGDECLIDYIPGSKVR